MKVPTLLGTSPSTSFDIPIDKLGPSGVRGYIHVVPVRQQETETEEARLLDRSLRKFVVSALLGKAPPTTQGVHAAFTESDGHSYLKPPDGKHAMKFYSP